MQMRGRQMQIIKFKNKKFNFDELMLNTLT